MLVNNRWEIVRRLGGGGMGEVHLARDRHQAEREVALKILRPEVVDRETIARFRDEFRSLTRLRHPNLAEVFDFGRVDDTGRPLLTMEYVDGRDLAAVPRDTLLEHFEDLAAQCLRALDYIHARGWLHNDIKPQNILVAPPFQVKLLDFGLAQHLASRREAGTSGTLHYLAPERLAGADPDVRSDLYSLGAVLYEILARRRPYEAPTPGRVVTAVLEGGAPSPRALEPSVPERWDRLIMALLERRPENRPASAGDALALLNTGAEHPQPPDTPETFASWVGSGRLVGRDAEAETLRGLVDAHASASAGPAPDEARRVPSDADPAPAAPRMAIVTGPAGSGKSRLVREMSQTLQLGGVRTLAARCHETGGALQPFADLLRAARAAGALPAELAAVLDQAIGRRERGRRAGAASSSAASHRKESAPPASAGKTAPTLDKAEMLAGLAGCLDRLAGDGAGVLVLEDLQWADAAGLDLLEHLLLRAPRPRWLVIATLRDDPPASDPLSARLRRLMSRPGLARLSLGPLDAGQASDLLASMLPFGEPPARLARQLVEKTGGTPLHIEEMLKGLFAEGLLERRGGTWTLSPSAGNDLPLPPSLATLVLRQVAALTPADIEIARMLAVLAKPVPIALLAGALGGAWNESKVRRSLETLQSMQLATLAWERPGGPWVSLSQATARAAIYGDLTTSIRRGMHRAAADAIAAHHEDALDEVAEDLAHHYAECGAREPAADFLLRAARRAAAVHDPLGQTRFLRRALDLMAERPAAERLEVLDVLCVGTLNELGDHGAGLQSATRMLDEARSARSRIHEIRALRHQSWALGFLGRESEALARGREALALARRARDRHEIASSLTYLGMTLARRGDHAMARDAFDEAVPLAREDGDPVTLTWILNNAGLCRIGLGEPEAAAILLAEVLEVARRHGLTGAYHRYLGNVGLARMDLGDLAGAVALLEEARAWSRQHTTLELLALQCESIVSVFLLQGRFDLAANAGAESRRARALLGAPDPSPLLLDLMGQAERDLGRFQAATTLHQQGLEEARRRADRTQEGYLLAAISADHLAAGDAAAARTHALQALQAGGALSHPRINFLADRVLAGLAAARPRHEEIDDLERRLKAHPASALRYQDQMERHLALGCLALADDQIPAGRKAAGRTAAGRDAARHTAASRARDAEKEARAALEAADRGGFREIGWRLRVLLGRALEHRGLPREAAAVYHEASALIETIAADLEDCAMRDDYRKHPERVEAGRLADATSDPVSSVPSAPRETIQRAGDGDAASRMLSTLFEITQVINSIHDPEELLDKVMDLAIEMVGAERGLIFLSRDEGDEMDLVVARNVERQTIRDATAYSRSILKEAGRGRSVLSHDAEHDARFREYRSVTRYQIRSLMCVPLNLRGRTIGTVYVDTRAPGVVFTPDHLKFLEAFAAQAAVAVDNARLFDRVRKENETLRQAVKDRYGFESIVGRSTRMRDIFALLSRVAPSNLPVMIRGESGTGKELVARAVHLNSPRRDRAFFSENCAALPDTLLESELFGHVRGAFTGADTSRKGLFEMADGGTLFLDEIGDMSMALQSKLLRALQNGEIRPLGSETTRKVNVRVLSATNRDLEGMIRARGFREDLYYRLKGVSVTLPPLRDRREDIPLLVDHFLARLARENDQPRLRVEPALLRELARRNWPGNVRELENAVYRLALFAEDRVITLDSARHDLDTAEPSPSAAPHAPAGPLTRVALRKALAAAKGNRNEAARLLGVSRATFFRKMRDLAVEAPRKGSRTPRTEANP